MNNYNPASNREQKTANWKTLNSKVFTKHFSAGKGRPFQVPLKTINRILDYEPGEVEQVPQMCLFTSQSLKPHTKSYYIWLSSNHHGFSTAIITATTCYFFSRFHLYYCNTHTFAGRDRSHMPLVLYAVFAFPKQHDINFCLACRQGVLVVYL